MTKALLTLSFSDRGGKAVDGAEAWAIFCERGLRELRFRARLEQDDMLDALKLAQATLAELVPARDAGDVCGVCGERVTWTDHLPPVAAGESVRCFANVFSLNRDVVIDDIFPRV